MDIFNLWTMLVISHSPWTRIPSSSNFFVLHWSAIDLDWIVIMLCYAIHFFSKVLCPLPLSLLQAAAIFILNEVASTYLYVDDSLSSNEVYLVCLSEYLPSSSAIHQQQHWNSFGYTTQEGLCILDKDNVPH